MTPPRITPEQYLTMERSAEFKSEYFEGQVYAMSGGTIPHAHIIANVTVALFQALKGGPCISYPDLTVVCGEAKYADDERDTLLNPTLIVEVFSPSTEGQDRGFKFAQYRKLDSLRSYMLVSQRDPRVENSISRRMGGAKNRLTRPHNSNKWKLT